MSNYPLSCTVYHFSGFHFLQYWKQLFTVKDVFCITMCAIWEITLENTYMSDSVYMELSLTF